MLFLPLRLRPLSFFAAAALAPVLFAPVSSLAADSVPASSSRIELFNGHDLNGWTIFNDPTKEASAVWTASDGVIRCAGKPRGYLRTNQTFQNYRLRVQ